jgi:hypothetical protein
MLCFAADFSTVKSLKPIPTNVPRVFLTNNTSKASHSYTQMAMAETPTESLSSLVSEALSTPAVSALLTPTTTTITFVSNVQPPSPGVLNWMFYFIASCIVATTRIFFWILSFCTITIPTLIFKILSISFTLTLNFSSLYSSPFSWTHSVSFSLLCFWRSRIGFCDTGTLQNTLDFLLSRRGRSLRSICSQTVRREMPNRGCKIILMR